jgi:hypothetical protein
MIVHQATLLVLVQFGCPPAQADNADRLSEWLTDRLFAAKLKAAAAKGIIAGICDRDTAMRRAIQMLHEWLDRYGY